MLTTEYDRIERTAALVASVRASQKKRGDSTRTVQAKHQAMSRRHVRKTNARLGFRVGV